MDYATYLAFLSTLGEMKLETFQKILTNKELLKHCLIISITSKRSLGLRYRFKEFYNKRVDLSLITIRRCIIATFYCKVEGAIYAQRSTHYRQQHY